MRIAKRFACLVLLFWAGLAAAADPAARIDALLQKYAALDQFSGAVLAAERGKVLFEKGYGTANREWDIPNAPDTKFRIGSVTKQFTSMLVLQLVQERKLHLDDTVAALLPGYRQDTGARITVHHLLNHTSGLPNYTDLPQFMTRQSRLPVTEEEMVRQYCSGDLQFEPGSQYRYSNSGYFLLGAIIAKVTGKPYEQNLRERILDPLGMKDSGYGRHEAILPRHASGFDRGGGAVHHAGYIDMAVPGAAGAMYSTVRDLVRWDQALYGDALLGPELKARMFTPGLGNYGYGWGIRRAPVGPDGAERTLIRHSGGIPGFSSHIVRVPEERRLVVLLSNYDDHGLQAIAEGILDILYGRTPPDPKRSLAEVLHKTCRERGVEAAVRQYRDIKAGEADRYRLDESELNALGYQLLGAGKTDDAITVFRLNVEAFPEGFNAYDSLAEAYMTAGRKEEAVKNYARSLELNPGNLNALEMLNKLLGK